MQPSKLAALEVDTTGGAPALPFGSCVQLEVAHGMWQHWSGTLQSSCTFCFKSWRGCHATAWLQMLPLQSAVK